jgi:hypothetical protein
MIKNSYAWRVRVPAVTIAFVLLAGTGAGAQAPAATGPGVSSGQSPWTLMYDGVLFATFNHETGPRGADEFVSTDWLMGMAMRQAGPGVLTLTGMTSLDRATTGPRGYRELFQTGESYHFIPLTDRQHPHDLLMQASVAWRIPLTDKTAITFVGAPVGEAALGPIAFMHRASAAENSVAPLSHHSLDSTHISMGVITLGVDRGPWTFESSVFNGTEPDDNRWDLVDPGPLDSWSARVTYKPSSAWEFQGSHGFLKNPEALEFAHERRTTGSAAWFRPGSDGFTAATFAFGQNNKEFHGTFRAALAEATRRQGSFSYYGRFESVQVETEVLQTQGRFHSHTQVKKDLVTAGTFGGVIELPGWSRWAPLPMLQRFEAGIGAELTSYVVPVALRAAYGDHPVSFRVFLRMRPPAGSMGRMWNMRMGRAMHH